MSDERRAAGPPHHLPLSPRGEGNETRGPEDPRPHLTDSPIDTEAMAARVMRASDGALAMFVGVVRDHHDGKSVESITYEAYRPMAEKEIAAIVQSVGAEFSGVAIAVEHRLGLLTVGDASIAIACASPHRAEAFAACREIIERVKKTVPIWKKERGPDGEEWVGWQGGVTKNDE